MGRHTAVIYLDTYTDAIDDTFRAIFLFGSCCFGRLSAIEARNAKITRALRIAAYFATLILSLAGVPSILVSFYPMPHEETKHFRDDVYTVFRIIWICRTVDCTSCFFINNQAYNLLSEKGFFDHCRKVGIATNSAEKLIRDWSRPTKRYVIIMAFCLICSVAFQYVILAGYILDVHVACRTDRMHWWLRIPEFYSLVAVGVSDTFAFTHSIYHGTLYSCVCNIVRVHFRIFCHGLESESGASFSKRLIDKYHIEYARLAAMAGWLDKAFRFSCLLQLCLVIVTICLCLFSLFRGVGNIDTFLLCMMLGSMINLFLWVAIPAIKLKEQAGKAKHILHHWFEKYYQRCEETEGKQIDEASRQAYSAFMQYLVSADVGITVCNLAKLDMPLILSVFSVIITYFLVIYQFNTPTICECDFNNSLGRNLTAFCMENFQLF